MMEDKKVYEINSHLLEHKYRGCGNGQIIVKKESGVVVDMDYLDEADWIIKDQNVNMHENAGEVLDEDDNTITFRANFSRCQACLF
jgi:hypothetical protein